MLLKITLSNTFILLGTLFLRPLNVIMVAFMKFRLSWDLIECSTGLQYSLAYKEQSFKGSTVLCFMNRSFSICSQEGYVRQDFFLRVVHYQMLYCRLVSCDPCSPVSK